MIVLFGITTLIFFILYLTNVLDYILNVSKNKTNAKKMEKLLLYGILFFVDAFLTVLAYYNYVLVYLAFITVGTICLLISLGIFTLKKNKIIKRTLHNVLFIDFMVLNNF